MWHRDAHPHRTRPLRQKTSKLAIIHTNDTHGHDHKEENATLTDASGNPVLVVETGCFTHAIGVVTWEDGKLAGTLVKHGEYDGQDATVAASIQEVADEVNESLGEVVGTTAFFLDGNRDPGVRTQETNLGDFVADAMLWEAQLSANSTPDAAFINGGGIRDSIDEGDITLKTIRNVCPFINYLCTVK